VSRVVTCNIEDDSTYSHEDEQRFRNVIVNGFAVTADQPWPDRETGDVVDWSCFTVQAGEVLRNNKSKTEGDLL